MKISQGKIKTILLSAMTIFALFATMSGVFAWFVVVNPSTKIDTVTGDMSISLNKLSAIKYVYPYYPGSNDFIDYSKEGKLKTYVLDDNDVVDSLEQEEIPSVEKKSDISSTNCCYLVGNSVFLGTDETPYSLSSGLILNSSSDGNTFSVKSVSLSVNSKFLLTDATGNVLPFSNITCPESSFLNKEKTLFLAKKAGFYDFQITKQGTGGYDLSITAHNREDSSILGMTLFDPTYAKLYDMSVEEAIYNQNTCLVYDIEISVKNEMRDFLLNLQVKRKALDNDEGKTGKNNQFCLSKYVSFKANIPTADTLTKQDIYDSFHKSLSSSEKLTYQFDGKKYSGKDETALDILKDQKISSVGENTSVHLYLAVDYDPKNMEYFFDESRLGISYDLIRDFTFYFSSVQSVATGENNNA
mgnify:CR=1 FL=1